MLKERRRLDLHGEPNGRDLKVGRPLSALGDEAHLEEIASQLLLWIDSSPELVRSLWEDIVEEESLPRHAWDFLVPCKPTP